MKQKSLKQQISEILVKWDMPCRQIAINEIVALFALREQQIREEILKQFNEKFSYTMGKPNEGSLELTHNNIRDLLSAKEWL